VRVTFMMTWLTHLHYGSHNVCVGYFSFRLIIVIFLTMPG